MYICNNHGRENVHEDIIHNIVGCGLSPQMVGYSPPPPPPPQALSHYFLHQLQVKPIASVSRGS